MYVPLRFALCEAFQFDWSEEWLVIGGIHRKVLAAHTKLCASRAFMLSGYPSQSHEMLFEAHTRAFTAFGGVPKRGIYDNMKTAMDKVSKGNGRVVNTRFFAMTAHYLFDPDFCNVASGWEKGVVEKNIQDMRPRLWNLLNYRHPCCSCKQHCDVENVNRLIESWQKYSACGTNAWARSGASRR